MNQETPALSSRGGSARIMGHSTEWVLLNHTTAAPRWANTECSAHQGPDKEDWQSDSTYCEKFSWIEFSRLIWERKKGKNCKQKIERSLCCLNYWKPVQLWRVLLKEHIVYGDETNMKKIKQSSNMFLAPQFSPRESTLTPHDHRKVGRGLIKGT